MKIDKIIMFSVVVILALAIQVEAKQRTPAPVTYSVSATDGTFTIYEKDIYDCFSSNCVIYPRVCNVKNSQRSFNISVFTDLHPTSVLMWQNLTTGIIQSGVDGNGTPIYQSAYAMQYGSLPSVLSSGVEKGNKYKRVNTNSIVFDPLECNDFKISMNNLFGGRTKYSIDFLDPVINATLYRGNFSLDINLTPSGNFVSTDRTIRNSLILNNYYETWNKPYVKNLTFNYTSQMNSVVLSQRHKSLTNFSIAMNVTGASDSYFYLNTNKTTYNFPDLNKVSSNITIRDGLFYSVKIPNGATGKQAICIRIVDQSNYTSFTRAYYATRNFPVAFSLKNVTATNLTSCHGADTVALSKKFTNITIQRKIGLPYISFSVNGSAFKKVRTNMLNPNERWHLQFVFAGVDDAGKYSYLNMTIGNITVKTSSSPRVTSKVMSFSTNVTRFIPRYILQNSSNKFRVILNVSCNAGTTWTSHALPGIEVPCIKKGTKVIYKVIAQNLTATSTTFFNITDLNLTFEQRCMYPLTEDWNISSGRNETCLRKSIDLNTSTWNNGTLKIINSSIVVKKQRIRNITLVSKANLTVMNSTFNSSNSKHTLKLSSITSSLKVNTSKLIKVDVVSPVVLKKFYMVSFTTTKSNRVPSSNISFTKNITNSTIIASRVNTTNIKNCQILDSTFRATQGCLNAYIDPSVVINSTTTSSTIKNATIQDSTFTFSKATGSTPLTGVIINQSNITHANITNSILFNVDGRGFIVTNSNLSNMVIPAGTNITNNQLISGSVNITYNTQLKFSNGATEANTVVEAVNSSDIVEFTALTNSSGYADITVKFTAGSGNYTLRGRPGSTNTNEINVFIFTTGLQSLQYEASASGGGGTTTTTASSPTEAQSVEELLSFPPEQLADLTTSEITSLIERLEMTTAEVLQLFAKMTLTQAEQTYPMLAGSGGSISEVQQAVKDTFCVSGDNKCATFCTHKEDLDCPLPLSESVGLLAGEKAIQYLFIVAALATVLFVGRGSVKKR